MDEPQKYVMVTQQQVVEMIATMARWKNDEQQQTYNANAVVEREQPQPTTQHHQHGLLWNLAAVFGCMMIGIFLLFLFFGLLALIL